MHLNIPADWAATLNRVQQLAPYAVLAGGALCDLDNMRPVKDIDIFYFANQFFGTTQELNGYRYSHGVDGHYIDGNGEVVRADVWSRFDGSPDLNLIAIQRYGFIGEVVCRVDFGICQVGYDRESVFFTDAYERDKANKTFTLTRADSEASVARSMRRYERLRQKYPGWKLVFPEHLMTDWLKRIADERLAA